MDVTRVVGVLLDRAEAALEAARTATLGVVGEPGGSELHDSLTRSIEALGEPEYFRERLGDVDRERPT